MIIETKKRFGELAEGESFFLIDTVNKRLLMKIETIFDEDNDCNLNAVSLSDGVFHSYDDDVEIIPISARCHSDTHHNLT